MMAACGIDGKAGGRAKTTMTQEAQEAQAVRTEVRWVPAL